MLTYLIFTVLFSLPQISEGYPLCNTTIPHGRIIVCLGYFNYTCSFQCDEGFEQDPNVEVECTSDSELLFHTHDYSIKGAALEPCKNTTNRCSVVIPHAMLNSPCGRTEGETCTYNCRYGWVPTYSSITCEQGLTWNKPLSKVCLKADCSRDIPNGYVSSACDVYRGAICYGYSCYVGFTRAYWSIAMLCNQTSEWEYNRTLGDDLCIGYERLCPSLEEHGVTTDPSSCHRTPGSRCKYLCRSGYENQLYENGIFCNKDGRWDAYTDALCLSATTIKPSDSMCPLTIPNGRIDYRCSRRLQNGCAYSCDSGSYPAYSWLECNRYGRWERADTACGPKSTTYPITKCPSTIPNGWIPYSCYRKTGYYCSFKCNSVRFASATQLYCNLNGVWVGGETACESKTTTHRSTSGDVYNGLPPVVGTVIAVLIVASVSAFCIYLARKRHQLQSTGSSAAVNVAFSQSAANRGSSPSIQISSSSDNSYSGPLHVHPSTPPGGIVQPPRYSIVIATTNDLPPSYDDVTANPTDFKVNN